MRLNEDDLDHEPDYGDTPMRLDQEIVDKLSRLSEELGCEATVWVRQGVWFVCIRTPGDHQHFTGSTPMAAVKAAEDGTLGWDRVGPAVELSVWFGKNALEERVNMRLSNATVEFWSHYSTVYQN